MPIANVLSWTGRSETTHANNQDLKEFIRAEMAGLRNEMAVLRSEIKGEIRAEIAVLRAEMHSALREQLMRFITIVFGLVTLATAIIKLFPNLF
jgi:hypothetical protein